MQSIIFTDGRTFTPSKIIAIGRNYLEHIREMNAVKSEQPILFLKPNSALCDMQKPILIPKEWGSVHHEIELAVCIGQTCYGIDEKDAAIVIAGYGMALDLTLRDIQSDAKKKGNPWATAKGFDNSCPVSPFLPAENFKSTNNLSLELLVNNELRQQGNTSLMLFKIPEFISFASKFFTLEAGDVLLTGTPSGVGPLHAGDKLIVKIEGFPEIQTNCY